MHVIIRGNRINSKKFEELLNRELNSYNIRVRVVDVPATGKQVLGVYPELIETVKYSPYTSQMYDENRIALAERIGEFERSPKTKFGVKSRYLHWYHWAILNDVMTYILDKLGVDYEIRSSVGRYRGWREWRKQLDLPYRPECDPAFLKRVVKPRTRFKGVPIYVDREKMSATLEKIDEAISQGKMRPKDLFELEDKILDATRAKDFFEGITAPDSIWECRPLYQAWFIYKYGSGSRAEEAYYYMTEEEKEKEQDNLEEWLEKVDPKSEEFEKFLEIFKERLRAHIDWAIEQYGPFEEILENKDDAGFPYTLAQKLLHHPYKPKITDIEIKKLIEKKESMQETLKA